MTRSTFTDLVGEKWGSIHTSDAEKHLGHSEEWPKCLFLLVGAAGFELATPCTPCKGILKIQNQSNQKSEVKL